MPHLILDHTANLGPADTVAVLGALHRTLIASGLFQPADIKGRAHVLDRHAVGDVLPGEGFVHLRLHLLQGRAPEVKAGLSRALLATLEQAWPPAPAGVATQLCVEVVEIETAAYAKSLRAVPAAG